MATCKSLFIAGRSKSTTKYEEYTEREGVSQRRSQRLWEIENEVDVLQDWISK